MKNSNDRKSYNSMSSFEFKWSLCERTNSSNMISLMVGVVTIIAAVVTSATEVATFARVLSVWLGNSLPILVVGDVCVRTKVVWVVEITRRVFEQVADVLVLRANPINGVLDSTVAGRVWCAAVIVTPPFASVVDVYLHIGRKCFAQRIKEVPRSPVIGFDGPEKPSN